VFTVLLSIGLGWLGNTLIRIRHQRRIVAQIEAAGGVVSYDYEDGPLQADGQPPVPPGPKLVRMCLGDDAFAQVRVAWLRSQQPNGSGSEPLLESLTELPALEVLQLEGPGFTDAEMNRVPRLESLENLSLIDTSISGGGIARLEECKTLKTLYLSGGGITDETATGFMRLGGLHGLELKRTQVTSEGLANVKNMRGLRTLNIYKASRVGDEGMKHLARLPELEVLILAATSVSDDGLARLQGLVNLRVLFVSNSRVSDAGLQHLASFENLKELSLEGANVSDAGLLHLSRLKLEYLCLSCSGVTDAGMQELAKMRLLRHLDISQTEVTDEGVTELVALTDLDILHIGPHVTEQAAHRLKQHLRNCRIYGIAPGGRFSLE
jgi:hypothetical protein